ncbi:MAG TPA: FHA domain-containing protein, partial [Anaerolineae bacterium]
MPSHGQLEIIRANGEIEFYTLDPAAGITNIGRHSDNDIIIDGAGVAPFHAILDHRQIPYLLILLSPEGQTRIGNEALVPHTPRSLQHWDNIEIDGHRLILIETEAADTGQMPGVATPLLLEPSTPEAPQARRPGPALYAPVPAEPLYGSPAGAGRTASSTTAAVPTPVMAGMFDSLPADYEDEALIINLSEHEWTINVEQTATFQVTVTNGGPIVATFAIGVQGLDPSWVEISEPQVNLFEGDRAAVTVSIRPPRLPSSRAGAHHFVVVVSSANYPGRFSRCGATVIINPYYQFGIGDLSPRRQTISWFKRFGTVTIPITNLGNNATHFRLDGADDERALSFEFDVPGETVTLAKQAELRFSSEETISVPISITPHSRQLIGLRKRSYPYTITTSPLEGGQTARSMLGELRSAPLIGPLWLLLLTLVFVFLLVWIVRPRLDMFMFADGGQTAEIQNGTPVAIRWRASFFTSNVAIDPPIEGLEQPLPRQGTVVAFPKESATYNLRGGNLLSDLASIFTPPTKAVQVDVTPIAPSVSFQADPNQVVGGEEEIVLSWTVNNADKIELFRQIGENGPIERLGDVSDQPTGSMRVSADSIQNTI